VKLLAVQHYEWSRIEKKTVLFFICVIALLVSTLAGSNDAAIRNE